MKTKIGKVSKQIIGVALIAVMLLCSVRTEVNAARNENPSVITCADITPGDGEVKITITNEQPDKVYAYSIWPAEQAAYILSVYTSSGAAYAPVESFGSGNYYELITNNSAIVPATNGEEKHFLVFELDPLEVCSQWPDGTDAYGYWMQGAQHLSATPQEGLPSLQPPTPSPSPIPAQASAPIPAQVPVLPPEPEKLPVNQVDHSNGITSFSTVEGIYNSRSVNGCTITTPLTQLEDAVGLTTEQKADGTSLKYFICDSRPSKTKTLLQETVAGDGYQLASVINVDLYQLQKGTVTPIRNTSEGIRITIGVPPQLQKEGRKFFVVCFDSQGNKIVMNNLNNDPMSITIDTTVFGLYAICYEE